MQTKQIDIGQLVADPGNARRSVTKDADLELVASVKAQGILAALLVRPKGSKFEVVAGHRRLAAAKAAGMDKVPCQVRDMTDEEAKEAQLVENLQREDLDPMDEAQAFADLLAKGKTLDQLHSQTGKPKAYIYRRSRLLKLSPAWLEALRAKDPEDRVPVESAEVVAQLLDTQEDQDGFLKENAWELKPGSGEAWSPDAVRGEINRGWMRRLKAAPWNLKEEGLAGCIACAGCPERSLAQQDLLGDAGKDDACTNGACWRKKLEAHSARLVANAKKEGKEVLTGKDAAAALEAAKRGDSKLVVLDSSPGWWGEMGNLRQALKGRKVPTACYAQGKNGQLDELVTRKDFYDALPKRSRVENPNGTGGQPKAGKLSPKEKAARRARLLDLKATAAAWPGASSLAVQKMVDKGVTLAALKAFAYIMIKHYGDHHLVNEPVGRLGIKTNADRYDRKGVLARALDQAKGEKDVLTIVWQTAVGPGLWDTDLSHGSQEVFKLAGVDWKAAKAAQAKVITAARAAKLAAKAGGKAPAPAKAAKKKKK